MNDLLAIDILLIAACAWLAIGLVGLAAPRGMRFISRFLFPLGTLVGLGVGATALCFLGNSCHKGPRQRCLSSACRRCPFICAWTA